LKKYLKLFWIFFRVGAFTFGGGYAMVPIIQKEIVEKEKLVEAKEFLDIVAVSQSLPGPIAVNATIFTGYKLLGTLGAVAGLLGTVLPSLIVIILLAIFYNSIRDMKAIQLFFKGVRPAIVALIFMSAIKLGESVDKTRFSLSVAVIAFISVVLLGLHPILVVIGCAAAGYLYTAKEGEDGLS
jgi:chromate transporter